MQTLRGEYFIKRDFGFYDTGVLAVLNPSIFNLYEVLRRFVWRSTKKGDSAVKKLVAQGAVLARVSQAHLGKHLGISREQTNKLIKQMKELGWVKIIELNGGRTFAYQLGERAQDSSGRGHEIFFADAWMSEVFGLLVSEADRRFGELPREDGDELDNPDDEGVGSLEEYHRALKSLRRLTIDQRVAFLREQLTDDFTPGVKSTSQGGVKSTSQVGVKSTSPGNGEKIPKEENDIELSLENGDFSPNGGIDETDSGLTNTHTVPTEQTSNGRESRSDSKLSQFDLDAVAKRAGEEAMRRAEEQLAQTRAREQKAANLKGKPKTVSERAQLGKLQRVWLGGLRERWPRREWVWNGKMTGQAQQLLKLHSFEVCEMTLSFVIEQWDKLKEEFFGGRGDFPSMGLVLKLIDRLAPKAQGYAEVREVHREYQAWEKANPRKMNPPADLRKRYDAALPELRALGLVK